MEQNNEIILFQDKEVRRVWHNEQWYFVILDVLEVLTNTKNAKQYCKDVKKQDSQLRKGRGEFLPPFWRI